MRKVITFLANEMKSAERKIYKGFSRVMFAMTPKTAKVLESCGIADDKGKFLKNRETFKRIFRFKAALAFNTLAFAGGLISVALLEGPADLAMFMGAVVAFIGLVGLTFIHGEYAAAFEVCDHMFAVTKQGRNAYDMIDKNLSYEVARRNSEKIAGQAAKRRFATWRFRVNAGYAQVLNIMAFAILSYGIFADNQTIRYEAAAFQAIAMLALAVGTCGYFAAHKTERRLAKEAVLPWTAKTTA